MTLTIFPVICFESSDIPALTAREFRLVDLICSAAANALAASVTASAPLLEKLGSIQLAVPDASAVAVDCSQLPPGDDGKDWRKAAPLLARWIDDIADIAFEASGAPRATILVQR